VFFGRYDYTIDTKGRLNFPAKFRDAMGESFVVLEWVDSCLFALPMEEVERLADKLESDELMDSWAISGDLFSTACEVAPDKQGRILLPAELRAYAGLEKDVTIIGNRNHAEIWATEVWNARRAAVSRALTEAGCTVLALAAENRSLEEVFLALTEKKPEQEAPAEGEEN